MLYKEALDKICPLDEAAAAKAAQRLDNLSKPLGSLGRLEDIVKRLAGITGEMYPRVDNKKVIVMCADNGVVDEGVTQVPRSVTASVAKNFFKGITGINVLAKHAGAGIVVVDIGVEEDLELPGLIKRKIRKGTWNIAKGPAMTREEAIKAIETGIEVVGNLKDRGVNLLGTGEMGIGNTTTSSAVASVLTGGDIDGMVGKGGRFDERRPEA